MDVKLREVLPFSVSGLQVRTLNVAEQQPDTARIGPMWERFFSLRTFSTRSPTNSRIRLCTASIPATSPTLRATSM